MAGFELYNFFLCLVVFLLFTAVFTVMIYLLEKAWIRCIENGLEDEKLYREYNKREAKRNKKSKLLQSLRRFFNVFFVAVCVLVFAATILQKATNKSPVGSAPLPKVVATGSMSAKLESNSYLFENELDNQIKTFDIVLLHKMPSEFDLKLYDIVAYIDNDMIVFHRIVGIEEPNKNHPDHRYFTLQGDAVQYPDVYPVMYEQMLGIYQNERVANVGSFVLFLQSPAGILCFLLLLFYAIAYPFAERRLSTAEDNRMKILLRERQGVEETEEAKSV